MKKITFCIPSKNNLRYLKSSIRSIKENSSTDQCIIVYVDSDNDGTEQWLRENGVSYLKNESDTPKGIAHAYNQCILASETEIVCMFHADMYMAKGFDTDLIKHLKEKTIVSATRIEPPLHPLGLEKIVVDFGMYPEDFKELEFLQYVEELREKNKGETTSGIFAPWLCYKKDILEFGLHDESFHSYHEDSDIFNRMLLSGCKLVQSWESFVYHFTCRGGQFQDGVEKITQDQEFHKMKNCAAANYIRKWGSWIKNDSYQHPIVPKKYDVGFVIKNCTLDMLTVLEPWCGTAYLEKNNEELASSYRLQEQPKTKFDLTKKILFEEDCVVNNDVVVEIDASCITQQQFDIIQNLSDIITNSGEVGVFELFGLSITINSMDTYEKLLVRNDSEYYTSKLL